MSMDDHKGSHDFTFLEFFAGGGMARAGLGKKWKCLLANDIDAKKTKIYSENWGKDCVVTADVRDVSLEDLKEQIDLAWASFPCQDLSLAGNGAGLKGARSGAFWPFWEKVTESIRGGNAPRAVVLENVYGAIISNEGEDLRQIFSALAEAKYKFGSMIIDAVSFVPQSRPRLFIVAFRDEVTIDKWFILRNPTEILHPISLQEAVSALPEKIRQRHIWWNMSIPNQSKLLSEIIEEIPTGVKWHSEEETKYLISLMDENNKNKIEEEKKKKSIRVGTLYRRTRNVNGKKFQRAEVRFDQIAGCLRTPSGGSSRQTVIIVQGKTVRSRLLSPREAARLMGLSENYKLPQRYNDAYHLLGDGVVVPVVTQISRSIIEPILKQELPLNSECRSSESGITTRTIFDYAEN